MGEERFLGRRFGVWFGRGRPLLPAGTHHAIILRQRELRQRARTPIRYTSPASYRPMLVRRVLPCQRY